MKIIDEKQFNYISNKVLKKLPKRDRGNLYKYRSTYRWYKDNNEKLKLLENEIMRRKEKKNQYVKDLIKKNKQLDHLRKDYDFSWSVSRLKNEGNYYNFSISRRQYNNKTGLLGSSKNIIEHLSKCLFYKNDDQKKRLIKKDWKLFLRREMTFHNSKVKLLIMDLIMKDVTLKNVSLNLESMFPLTKKDYPLINRKGANIPLMITNKMRWELNHLGYSKKDIKYITPKEAWKIIEKDISKKP